MSSIPTSKMKHAHAHDGDHPEQTHPSHQAEAQGGEQAELAVQDGNAVAAKKARASGSKQGGRTHRLAGRAETLAEEAVDAVKARPKTAAAIGAGLLAGAAALFGGSAAARALRGEDKPAAKRKPAAKKPAAKRAATKKG